ncbi:hypothetical protein ACFWVM_29165 [Nocardia fluminea]|uniref:hypothetical protein n=1 Tax=Nocardia fluminea TaxID=134984 RepID=UPI0036500690
MDFRKMTSHQVAALRRACDQLGVRFNPADYQFNGDPLCVTFTAVGQLGGAVSGYFRSTPIVQVDSGGGLAVQGVPRPKGLVFKGSRLMAYQEPVNLTHAANWLLPGGLARI